jgi:hypothetical protein
MRLAATDDQPSQYKRSEGNNRADRDGKLEGFASEAEPARFDCFLPSPRTSKAKNNLAPRYPQKSERKNKTTSNQRVARAAGVRRAESVEVGPDGREASSRESNRERPHVGPFIDPRSNLQPRCGSRVWGGRTGRAERQGFFNFGGQDTFAVVSWQIVGATKCYRCHRSVTRGGPQREEIVAKGQLKGNREAKKPNADKNQPRLSGYRRHPLDVGCVHAPE